MNLKTLVTVGATIAMAVVGRSAFAQDDLDDLLNDLEASSKTVEKAEEAVAEKVAEAVDEKVADEKASEADAVEEKAVAKTDDAKEAVEEAADEEEVEEASEEKAVAKDEGETAAEEKEEAVAEKEDEKPSEEKTVAKKDDAKEVDEVVAAEDEEEVKEEESEEEVAATDEKKEEEKAATEEKEVAKKEEVKPATEEKPVAKKEVAKKDDLAKDVAAAAGTAADDEVLSLLDELSAETKPEAAVAEVKEEAPAEEAEEPVAAADEKVAAENPVEKQPAAVAKTDDEDKEVEEDVEKIKAKTATKKSAVARNLPPRKDEELLAQIAATESLRRRAYDQQAKRFVLIARDCMSASEYMEAAKNYRHAQRLLNDSAGSEGLRRECAQGLAEGVYRAAMQENATGRRERAIKLMNKAVDLRHPRARVQLEEWLRTPDKTSEKIDVSEISHRQNDADYKETRAKNLKHLRRSRQLLGTRELDRALDECELVLISDPYNQEAIRLREKIVRKMHTIVSQERKAAREGMMADVDKAWRPVYAVDAREIEKTKGQTLTTNLDKDPERAQEQLILKRMREMKLPEISFKPPATIYDAVQFFISASKDYDRPELPLEERGFGFQMISATPTVLKPEAASEEEGADGFGASDAEESESANAGGAAVIPTISVNNISFYDALTLICESVGYKFKVKNGIVVVMPKGYSTEEMVTRSYPVLSSFMERMTSASSDMKEMQSAGFGGSSGKSKDEGDSENKERDWKEFFSMLGVQWPEGSSIMYIKTIGKLRVKNTYENLAELEKALTEMNADPKLIEIEARFVEVCQEDLNSLGFEWILNSDYTLGVNKKLGRALGLRPGHFESAAANGTPASGADSDWITGGPDGTGGGSTMSDFGKAYVGANAAQYAQSQGATWNRGSTVHNRNMGVNAFGGEGSKFQSGNRYLSTLSNHISGEGYSNNDQFMRVNAFLGNADLSMILHMLSQRSDTDLLSAPKVLTRPGEEAVIKVVTEYIYPTDYDVQLQSSSSSSGGSSSGGGQSAILAVVEPQSFTMREVGVILDVTPTLTDDGNLIDLKMNTQVIDEPTWKNYGMRIPFTGNTSLQSFEGIGEIFTGLGGVLTAIGTGVSAQMKEVFATKAVDSASQALENLSSSGGQDNMTYYDAPMEQPFFHVRSIDSSVSVYPGATIVMGGLITEARKAMDDKIPFLGDLPFIGRFFRSHSEQTNKRNLLIFVTTRLVDVRGREVAVGALENDEKEAEVKPAPKAEEAK